MAKPLVRYLYRLSPHPSTMLRCATLLALLVLTWTQQGGSTMYGNKCSSKEHMKLFSILDKCEAAADKILHSEEHKKLLCDANKKFRSKICELNLDAEALSKIILDCEEGLKKIQNGSISEELLIKFLGFEPTEYLEAYHTKNYERK